MYAIAKKTILAALAIVLVAPFVAFAAPSSVNRVTDHIEPLITSDYLKIQYVTATSTTGTSTLPRLSVQTGLDLFGTYANSLDDLCVAITGSAALCDGDDATGAGGGSSAVATSTNETAGQLSYWTTTSGTPAKLGKVATSSVTINAPLTSAGTPGYVVGGSGWTLDVDDIGAADLAAADFGSFTCNGTTCTVDSQAISASMLANADFGDFTCSSGSCTVDANAIALGTDTTGNYIATIAGTANQVDVSGSGSETAAVTLSLPAHVIFPGNFQATNSTTTNATSTAMDITGLLTFGGVTGNSWDDFCTAITGAAGLCDGSDATGSGGSGLATSTTIADTWVIYGTSANDVGAEAAFNYDDATDRLTVVNASTTRMSCLGSCAFGSTATSSFSTAGALTLATPLAVTSGGTGASSLNDLITLGTMTTGNYVATVSSSGSITVGNSGSETAAVTVNLNLANANSWTAKQDFANASSTLLSANQFWAGQTATTSISSGGDLTVGGGDIVLGTTNILSGGDTASLNEIDAINATTESTIEAAIDTLANLTSVQGQTISISAPLTIPADPNADRFLFWDDSAGATAWLTPDATLSISGTSLTVVDVTCTDCLGTTEIADSYLLNNGDVGTGAYDFGGASDFEIPNGASPTVDAIGEIALDTTYNELIVATSTNASFPAVFTAEQKIWGRTVASTSPEFASSGRIPLAPVNTDWTITKIICIVDGGTSVVINVDTLAGGANTTTATCGTSLTTQAISANTSVASTTAYASEFGTVTGSVDYVTFSVWGYPSRH